MAVGYGTKTYKPGLLLACKALRAFIVRWKVQLEESLTPGGYTNLLQLLDAVETVISLLSQSDSADFVGNPQGDS